MATTNNSSGRGFASMDEDKRQHFASEGGSKSGGNFKNDPERAKKASKKQPLEAKRKGGRNSHRNS